MHRRRSRFALPAASLLLLSGCAPAVSTPPAATPGAASAGAAGSLSQDELEAAARVTASSIDAPLRYLSHDLLEGRAPGTRGDDLAVQFLASEMESMGLQPGVTEGSGKSWFQKVPLVGINTRLPPAVTFSAGAKGSATFAVPTDFVVMSGVQDPKATLDASDVVFVGYGIVAPEYGWDDYKNADVKGKVVLVMNDDPSSDPSLFAGKRRLWYGRWDYKYLEAAKHGAAGAIVIHTTPSAAYPWQVVVSSNARERFQLPAVAGEPRLIANMWATEDASRKIAGLGGKDLDVLRAAAEKREFAPVPLGVKLAFSFTNELRTIESMNVVGVLPGTDPALAGEAVVYSAHHDHLGIGRPKEGDAIYNGAVDNASGCATLLSVARAAALSKPTRRSRVFLAVTAEEQGLLGSEWYAKHPTFPAGRIAVDINVDSANVRGRTSDVGFAGYGRSTVDPIVEAIARAQGRTVHAEPFPEKGGYYRSDQFSFAKVGIPGIFLRGGPSYVGRPPSWGEDQANLYEKLHYHQPSDEYSKDWDLSGAVEDAQLLLLAGSRIANDAALPAWKPGDEFEAVRKAQVAAPASAAPAPPAPAAPLAAPAEVEPPPLPPAFQEAYGAARKAVAAGDMAAADKALAAAATAAGDDPHLGFLLAHVRAARFARAGDFERAAASFVAVIPTLARHPELPDEFWAHNAMMMIREAQGDPAAALVENDEATRCAARGSWDPKNRADLAFDKDRWHRAYLSRMLAESRTGSARQALVAYAQAALDEYRTKGYPEATAVLEAYFAALDGNRPAALAAARRIDPAKDDDLEDLYLVVVGLEAGGDHAGAEAVRQAMRRSGGGGIPGPIMLRWIDLDAKSPRARGFTPWHAGPAR